MPRSFVPRADAKLNDFGVSFTQQLNDAAGPEVFGLTAEEMNAFIAAQAGYTAAYVKSQDMATRGPSATQGKQDARRAFVDVIRQTVRVIQTHPGLTDQQRRDLQITIPDPVRTPVPPPAAELQINITGVEGTLFHVRLSDPAHPTRRRKPDGVKTATILYHVGDAAPTTIEGWMLQGTVSRTRTAVQVNPTTPPGSKVWMIGYWSNAKGQSGMPSEPVCGFTQFTEGGLTELRLAA